jgi:hypothetical protein
VIVFLAFDAYVIYRVMRAHRAADDYGTIEVPGELGVMVPGGKLKLTYQESYRASGGEDSIDFGVPAALEVSVTSPAGEPLDIKGPGFGGMGASLSTGRGWSRALIGTAETSEVGEHTVTVRGDLEGAIEPRVLVGK